MNHSQALRAYVDENDKSVFVCPSCGFEKRFDASIFKEKKKNITVKCKCGLKSELTIEFRKHIRKSVEIIGQGTLGKIDKKFDVIVKDISLNGLALEFMIGDRKHVKELSSGDSIKVSFELDNDKGWFISKDCIVRSVRNLRVGVEFRDDNFSKKIGFYVMDS
ncbi:MAG: PilZ domain-containing protein [Desulfamplus sp.]|nr:PilZ domain-containing protein [Desulfamplus sp.]